jgi:phosphatidylglycerophosphate synthase
VCIGLNWLGDSLDGTLARVRRQLRPRYGFYVDHMVDVLGAAALMSGLGCSGFLHWQTAAAMLVSFLLLARARSAIHCRARFSTAAVNARFTRCADANFQPGSFDSDLSKLTPPQAICVGRASG